MSAALRDKIAALVIENDPLPGEEIYTAHLILQAVAAELDRFVVHDEEGALECIRAAADGLAFVPPMGWKSGKEQQA